MRRGLSVLLFSRIQTVVRPDRHSFRMSSMYFPINFSSIYFKDTSQNFSTKKEFKEFIQQYFLEIYTGIPLQISRELFLGSVQKFFHALLSTGISTRIPLQIHIHVAPEKYPENPPKVFEGFSQEFS